MSLPPLLFDTYKQYKVGTSNFVSWLGRAAEDIGLVDEAFTRSIPSDTKGKGRLKGKARTAAACHSTSEKIKIRSADFLRLAKDIAAVVPEQIPDSIVQTLGEVITARKQCAGWFTSHQTSDSDSFNRTNEQHQHFIQVLEDVYRILTESNKSGGDQISGPNSSTSPSCDKVKEISNRFEYLEVEDPAEWTTSSLPSKSAKHSKPAKQSKPNATYELEPSDEEISFAIFCLFKDLTDIRHYVRTTWAEYRERQIAFTTAAVTMNTAIAVLRRLNEEFIANFPQFDDHHKILDYLYDGYCNRNGTGELAAYETAEFSVPSEIVFCEATCYTISSFFTAGGMPFYRKDESCEFAMSEDDEILLQCLSLFGLIAKHGGMEPSDQLMKGLCLAKTSKKLYTWVVLAIQLFVDTRHVVGISMERCFDEFCEMQEWLSTTVRRCQEFGVGNKVNNWHRLNGRLLSNISFRLEHIANRDCVQDMVDDHFGTYTDDYSWGSFFLLRNHPMLCGLIIQTILTELHEIGIGLCGDQVAIMSTIHLYNAAHQSSNMSASIEWTDLEKLIEWQGPSYLFVGDRPKLPRQCFVHLHLALGISAAVASQDRNGQPSFRLPRGRLPKSAAGSRTLRLVPLYSDLRNSPVGRYNGAIRWKPTRASEDLLVMLEMMAAKRIEHQDPGGQNSRSTTSRACKKSAQTKLAPVKMISLLKECFQEDEKIFRFDLFVMNERCITLLRKIQKVCINDSPLFYPRSAYGHDYDVPDIVTHMLAGETGVKRRQPTRFREACVLLQELIGAEGDKEWKNAEMRCFVDSAIKKVVKDNFETPE